MTRDDVKAVLKRVLTRAPERQQEAIEILTAIEVSDSSQVQLADDQLEEVRRRTGRCRRADIDALRIRSGSPPIKRRHFPPLAND